MLLCGESLTVRGLNLLKQKIKQNEYLAKMLEMRIFAT